MRVLVAGAGGFIGGHLVADLLKQGHKVRAVDDKPAEEWFQWFDDAQNCAYWDLRHSTICELAVENMDYVYNLAADMGGIGFIEGHKAECMLSVLINTNLLRKAKDANVKRYFFSSSACVYNQKLQKNMRGQALRESSAYPAEPEDGYGWEKLFSERMCRHFREDFGLETRVARFHNCYGPHGSWYGGREKAPAAICRKVIEAKHSGSQTIEVWGSGMQTRSFMYIDDCVKGIQMIMNSDILEPINLGSEEVVSIDRLVDMTSEIAGVRLTKTYDLDAPKGVNGRNSDNTMIRKRLNWEPDTPLKDGLAKTYEWIEGEYLK